MDTTPPAANIDPLVPAPEAGRPQAPLAFADARGRVVRVAPGRRGEFLEAARAQGLEVREVALFADGRGRTVPVAPERRGEFLEAARAQGLEVRELTAAPDAPPPAPGAAPALEAAEAPGAAAPTGGAPGLAVPDEGTRRLLALAGHDTAALDALAGDARRAEAAAGETAHMDTTPPAANIDPLVPAPEAGRPQAPLAFADARGRVVRVAPGRRGEFLEAARAQGLEVRELTAAPDAPPPAPGAAPALEAAEAPGAAAPTGGAPGLAVPDEGTRRLLALGGHDTTALDALARDIDEAARRRAEAAAGEAAHDGRAAPELRAMGEAPREDPRLADRTLGERVADAVRDTANVGKRAAVGLAEGAVAIPTLAALGAETGLAKLGALEEGSHPVSALGLRAIGAMEGFKEERLPYTFDRDPARREVSGASRAVAQGGELVTEILLAGALSRGVRALAARGVRGAAARTASGAAQGAGEGVATAAERRALDAALKATAAARPAQDAGEAAARAYANDLSKAYGRALVREHLREGALHAARAAARPTYWKASIASRGGLEAYQTVLQNGGSDGKATAWALGDAALNYLILGLGDGAGAFMGGAQATLATQFVRALGRGGSHPNLYGELAGAALRLFGGAASAGGSTAAHLSVLQAAGSGMGDEEKLAATVTSTVFGAAAGALASVRPVRNAILADKRLALLRQGLGPGPGAAPSPAPDAPAPTAPGGAAAPAGQSPSAPAWAQIARTYPTGDVRFRDGSLWRADSQTFLMPNGAVVDPEGNLLTAAPPPAPGDVAASGVGAVRTDEQINGEGFRPLAQGESFETTRREVAALRGQASTMTRLGLRVGVLSARDAKKVAYSTKPGENVRAHQYAAKNILPLAARADVAVRQDNYKRHGKGSGPATYVRLFAPFVFGGEPYVAVIAQYEADRNGIHAVEVLNVIRAHGAPEVISRETQWDAMPTGGTERPDVVIIPQSGGRVNDLSVETVARLIDNPGKSAGQRPRLLSRGEGGAIVETPCDAAAVAERLRASIGRLLAEEAAGAGGEPQKGRILFAEDAANLSFPSGNAETGLPPPDAITIPQSAAAVNPAEAAPQALALYDLLRAADVRVHNVPLSDIQVNRDIRQFKAEADPRTGVVQGEALQGEFQAVPAKPILLLEKADGALEVVTGRHRLDLARRNGLGTIPANIIRMADGWTLEMARALDAYDNILDEKGSDRDFIDFFRRANIDRATARAKGLLARRKGRDAFDVAEYAGEDLCALAMEGTRMDAQTAAAIAREAPVAHARGARAQGWNQNIQQAVARAVLEDGLRADDAAIMARSLRQAYARRAQGDAQLDLFGNDEAFLLAMAVEAKFAAQQVRQIDYDLRGLKTAAGRQSGNLAARDTLIRKYALEGPEDRAGMARAIAALEERKRRWQSYHTDPELAALAHAHAKRALRLDALEEEAARQAAQDVAQASRGPEAPTTPPAEEPAPAPRAFPLKAPPKRTAPGTDRLFLAWQRAHALEGLPEGTVALLEYGDFVSTYEDDAPALRAITDAESVTRYGKTLVGAPKGRLPEILARLAAEGRPVLLVPATLDRAELRLGAPAAQPAPGDAAHPAPAAAEEPPAAPGALADPEPPEPALAALGLTDEQLNGPGFQPLAPGENLEAIEQALRKAKDRPLENATLGLASTIGTQRNAAKLTVPNRDGGEDPNAHRYAAKNLAALYAQAEVAVRHADKKLVAQRKANAPHYIRLFAPFVHDGETYVALISQRDSDQQAPGVHAIEALRVIKMEDASVYSSGPDRQTVRSRQADASSNSQADAQSALTEDKVAYTLGDVKLTDPRRLDGEPYSPEDLLADLRAAVARFEARARAVAAWRLVPVAGRPGVFEAAPGVTLRLGGGRAVVHGLDAQPPARREALLAAIAAQLPEGTALESAPAAPGPGALADPAPGGVPDTPAAQRAAVRARRGGTPGWLRAPNGAPSNLPEALWVDARTPAFKRWFGDWEGRPETIHPRLLDANGEPRVFWHNSPAAGIRVFDPARGRAAMDIQGVYFSPDRLDAAGYGAHAYPVFLALRRPADASAAYAGFTPGQSADAGARRAQALREQGYDGVIVEDEDYEGGVAEVVVLDPKAIKSAGGNSGAYDPTDPDILANPTPGAPGGAPGPRAADAVVYPNGGRAPVIGSRAAQVATLPLSLPHAVELFRRLSGKLPGVVAQRGRGPRDAMGWYEPKTNDVFVRAHLFGLLDRSDEAALKARLRARGLFRNEDPAWCLAMPRAAIAQERRLSEERLARELQRLVTLRTRGGVHQGAAAKVMAHELWHAISASGGVPPRDHGNLLGQLYNLKRCMAQALPENAFATDATLRQEAAAFIDRWRGLGRHEPYFDQPHEAYAEMGAAFFLDPDAVREHAPAYHAAMLEGLERYPKAFEALAALRDQHASGADLDALQNRLEATWQAAHEARLRRLRDETSRPTGDERRMVLVQLLWNRYAPVAMVLDQAQATVRKRLAQDLEAGNITRAQHDARLAELDEEALDIRHHTLLFTHRHGTSKAFLADIYGLIGQRARAAGVTMNDLNLYLHLKRVIELGGRATALGIDPPTARTLLAKILRQRGPAHYRALARLANTFHEAWRRDVLGNQDVIDMLGPDKVRELAQNRHYVTMRHLPTPEELGQAHVAWEKSKQNTAGIGLPLQPILLELLGQRAYGAVTAHSGVASALKRLEGSLRQTEAPLTATAETGLAILEAAQRNALTLRLVRALRAVGYDQIAALSPTDSVIANARVGTVEYMENGKRVRLAAPRPLVDALSGSLREVPYLTAASRFLGAAFTTNMPAFIPVAALRDLDSLYFQMPGMKRGLAQWLGAYAELIPAVGPLRTLRAVANVGNWVSWCAQFIPPHVMRTIAKHPIGRLLYNEKTVGYWNSVGAQIARIIQTMDFEGALSRAAQARAQGNDAKADELEYCVQMARHALEDGVLLTYNQQLADDYLKGGLQRLFDKYHLRYDDDLAATHIPRPLARLVAHQRTLWRERLAKANAIQNPAKRIAALAALARHPVTDLGIALWNATGFLSEYQSMMVKLAGWAYLHDRAAAGTLPPLPGESAAQAGAPPAAPEAAPAPRSAIPGPHAAEAAPLANPTPLAQSANALRPYHAEGPLRAAGLDGLPPERAQAQAYAQAEQALPVLGRALQGAADALGAGLRMRPGLKDQTRAAQKVAQDYAGDWARLPDLIGGTLILGDANTYPQALDALRANLPAGANLLRVKPLNMRPGATGYQDVKVTLRLPNGALAETILVTRRILEAKQSRGGHKLYELRRVLDKYRNTGNQMVDGVLKDLDDLEAVVYAPTPSPDFESIKARASSSVQRLLRTPYRGALSEADINAVKSLSSGIHLAKPPSVDSYATPNSSQIKNAIPAPPSLDATTLANPAPGRQPAPGAQPTPATPQGLGDPPVDGAAGYDATRRRQIALYAADRAGDPNFVNKGILVGQAETAYTPYLNARMKGFSRTLARAIEAPGEFALKALAFLAPSLLTYLLYDGTLKRAVKTLFFDGREPDDAQRQTLAGNLHNTLAWEEAALKNISPYTRLNYFTTPLWMSADRATTLSLKYPIPEEVKPFHLALAALLNRSGLDTGMPAVGLPDILAEIHGSIAPSAGDRGLAVSLFDTWCAPWLDQTNPWQTYRQANQFSDDAFKARYLTPMPLIKEQLIDTWNGSPLVSLSRLRRNDREGDIPDDLRALQALLETPIVGPVIARFASIDSKGRAQTVAQYARLAEARKASLRLQARAAAPDYLQAGTLPPAIHTLPPEERRYFIEALIDAAKDHTLPRSTPRDTLRRALNIPFRDLRDPALRATL